MAKNSDSSLTYTRPKIHGDRLYIPRPELIAPQGSDIRSWYLGDERIEKELVEAGAIEYIEESLVECPIPEFSSRPPESQSHGLLHVFPVGQSADSHVYLTASRHNKVWNSHVAVQGLLLRFNNGGHGTYPDLFDGVPNALGYAASSIAGAESRKY